MAEFPKLKTGAVTQYPAARRLTFMNQVVEFLDGDEQRYRDSEGPARQWSIQLEMLDESETAALEEFFRSQDGRFGSFAFTDPMDGATYADCSLEADEFNLELEEEMRAKTSLTVRENRS